MSLCLSPSSWLVLWLRRMSTLTAKGPYTIIPMALRRTHWCSFRARWQLSYMMLVSFRSFVRFDTVLVRPPLTFALLFLDHSGVPNAQLLKENPSFSSFYHNRSVAEQNSLDIAWQLLMEDRFQDLRAAIYSNDEELYRFRQLLVNSVMATDIADKELKQLRNARWEKAFHQDFEDSPRDSINRKATIVIEHLIQASDVAHTMQ